MSTRRPPPRPGGTLRYYGPGGLDHLDPAAAYYAFSHQITRLFARQLFGYPTTEDARALVPVPDVAAEVPTRNNGGLSRDRRTYTIWLRESVRWDTVPPRLVTAEDFVRGVKRMANPVAGAGAIAYYTSTIVGMAEFAEGYRACFAGRTPTARDLATYQNDHDIRGLWAVDDRTLVIELLRPANDLLNLLAMPFASAAPREYDDLVPDGRDFARLVRSNGPYRITSYVPGSHLTMAHNPAWQAETDPIRRRYVDRIDVRMARVSDERVRSEITSGRADLSWGAAVGRPRRRTAADRDLGWALNPYLVFNLRSPHEQGALRDRRVRLAIAYAVDKARLVRYFDEMNIGTRTRPARTVIPPGNVGHRGYDPYPTPGDRGDRGRCRELLAEAGHPGGLTLTMIYRIDAVHGRVAKAIAEDLAAGGVDVRLVEVDRTDEYYRILQDPRRAAAGEWDLTPAAFMPDWFGNNGRSYVQPMFQSHSAVGTANYGGYHSPVVDELIDRALAAQTEARAAELWHQVDRQVLADVAVVPILVCEPTIEHLTSDRVRNAIPLPHVDRWYDASNLWLDAAD